MNDAREELLDESNPELVALLREEIAAEGRITFARFMELAQYHPLYGYYTADSARAGFEGDFLTAPETDQIFGHTLARQIAQCWELLDRPAGFTVRETGAGRGVLAANVVEGLGDEFPETLQSLHYELADVNVTRVAEALARVARSAETSVAGSTTDSPITGVMLANELLDALPFHRVAYLGGRLCETWVTWRDGWFADDLGPLSDPRLAEPFTGLELVEGQRAEVSLAARDWARNACGQIERGFAILIDYGYPAVELYSAARAGGTLKTYHQHLVAEDPYRRVGLQDITAHVDFTAISEEATAAGCDVLGLTTQSYFFAGLGIEERLVALQHSNDPYRYVNAREAVMQLLDPRGLGRFRVLVLGKGVDSNGALRGLGFRLE